jgi:acyl-CoA synthetase (AMP-forming)/AMP-acid ligase II
VVLRDGASADEVELIDYCRDRIASYKKPRSVVFTDALPRTGAGLVDRDAVDEAFGGGGYPGSPS